MVKIIDQIDENINLLINKCLSTSGVCGKELRDAHYELGNILGNKILIEESLENKKIAVIIMMRAGMPFGLGIADKLDNKCNVQILFDEIGEDDIKNYDYIIIADAVVNTGKTILKLSNNIEKEKLIIATNVISEKYFINFDDLKIYATRISKNSYKGSAINTICNGKGPDTGDRLFNNKFYSSNNQF